MNSHLTSLDGLSCLTEIRDENDLGDLETIGTWGSSSWASGQLLIDENPALSDVTALHGVESVASDFHVSENATHATTAVEALRDAIGSENIGGNVTISGNGR
jgi:hypothetical protein